MGTCTQYLEICFEIKAQELFEENNKILLWDIKDDQNNGQERQYLQARSLFMCKAPSVLP